MIFTRHIPNITFIYIVTLAILSKRLLDAHTRSFRPCPLILAYLYMPGFTHSVMLDTICFAQSGIFFNLAF